MTKSEKDRVRVGLRIAVVAIVAGFVFGVLRLLYLDKHVSELAWIASPLFIWAGAWVWRDYGTNTSE